MLISPAVLFFLWTLSLAFKNEAANMAYPPVFIPNPPTFANFVDVFAKNDFLTDTINSVTVSFSATCLALLLGVPTGYGIAKAKASKAAGLLVARVTLVSCIREARHGAFRFEYLVHAANRGRCASRASMRSDTTCRRTLH